MLSDGWGEARMAGTPIPVPIGAEVLVEIVPVAATEAISGLRSRAGEVAEKIAKRSLGPR
jgi:hypothetical protein